MFDGGVEPGSDNCELNCAILGTDMGTFTCSSNCESLCKTIMPRKYIEKYVYPKSLTKREISLISKFPKDAIKVFRSKLRAGHSTEKLFGWNGRNDESDAFRHFIWSGLITEAIGQVKAKLFLQAHEMKTNQPKSELDMDTFNNSMGIEASLELKRNKKFSLENLEKSAISHLRKRKLIVIEPIKKGAIWER